MTTSEALILSLIIVAIIAILILIIVNVRIHYIKKKYRKDNNFSKNDSNQAKNSIINQEANIDFKSDQDYFNYFNLLSIEELKKALINLDIKFDEKNNKKELIELLIKKLNNGKDEK